MTESSEQGTPQSHEMLDDIDIAVSVQTGGITLSEWEEEFVESISNQLDEGRTLTDSQYEKLNQIWDRV